MDLSKYMEKKIRVRFNGGREGELKITKKLHLAYSLVYFLVVGTLMGYDPLLNLVLDHTVEYQRGIHGCIWY